MVKLVLNDIGHLKEQEARPTLSKAEAALAVRIVDAGQLEALRHYADHGKLPVEAPVWGKGATVEPSEGGWLVYDAQNRPLGVVTMGQGQVWRCYLSHFGEYTVGPTPQAAVDAVKEWLRKRWCL